jgi:hypothetical protein
MTTNSAAARTLPSRNIGGFMKRIVLIFGLISGAILGGLMAVSIPLTMKGTIDFDKGEIIGYTSMVLAFVMVFVGIRSYRENVGAGAITFGKAFQVGILITLISCAMYVASWEVIYHGFLPDFDEKYAAHVVQKLRTGGGTAEAVAAKEKEMADFRKLYANPLINVGMTFLEAFPVGLIMTLVSAGILRRRVGVAGQTAVA